MRWIKVRLLDHLFCVGAPDGWPLLLEDGLRGDSHLLVLHIFDHFLSHVVHLEDLGGRWALLLILRHELVDELLELGVVVRRDRVRIVLHDLEDEAEQVVALEWLFESAELVEDNA